MAPVYFRSQQKQSKNLRLGQLIAKVVSRQRSAEGDAIATMRAFIPSITDFSKRRLLDVPHRALGQGMTRAGAF